MGTAQLSPHVEELLRGLLHRLRSLDEELEDLVGRRSDGARPGVLEALQTLRDYPADMQRVVLADAKRRRGRADALASKLRAHSETVVEATRRLQEWFAGPYNADVPVALLDAVEATCRALDIGQRHAVITVGPPTRLETTVPDVRAVLYGNMSAGHEQAPEESRRQFALLTIPRHEGRSPRWWPVILGHELSHLRVRHLSQFNLPPGGEEGASVEGAGDALPEDIAGLFESSFCFVLKQLGILRQFPFEDMREAIRREAADEVSTAAVREPPGLTPRRDNADDDAPPTRTGPATLADRVQIANRWATEIVCDLVMARRFGPAAVAALGSYLTAIGDYSVVSPTHPPGWLRISILQRYLEGTKGAVLSSVLEPWKDADDTAEQDAVPAWAGLLSEYLVGSFQAFEREVDQWPGERYRVEDAEREAAVVLAQRQLSFGLPPHDAHLREFPAGLAEAVKHVTREPAPRDPVRLNESDIINAGWAAVMAGRREQVSSPPRDVPFDRLVLKALEDQQLLGRIRRDTPEGESDASAPDVLGPPARRPRRRLRRPAGTDPYRGVLGREAIEARLQESDPARRLIVTPRLVGGQGDASIDVRLGNRFITFQRSSTASLNALRGHNPREVQRLVERAWGQPFVLHPGEVVLASVLEYVALPQDLSAQVITRSSYGRLGLITATAVQVHPLYRGCLTLELVNLGIVPLELYPGERVAQLVFLAVARPEWGHAMSGFDPFSGRYSCPTGPEFPRVEVDPWVQRTVPGACGPP